MNQSEKLKLFGSPCWINSSGTTVIPQGQFLWLLAYVALQDDWVSRKDLAELLWDDVDLASGLNNLRQLLHRNKNLEWAQMLESSSQALRLTGNTDVKNFRRACQAADWQTALLEYSGSLLKGLRPQGLEQLESFFESERSILQNDWREALIGRTQTLEQQGSSMELFGLLQQLLEADPYNEEALHSLLKQALKIGQLEKGTLAFQTFRQRLKSDLGLLPLPETLRLAEQVSGSELVSRASETNDVRLMGRESEKALVQSQLESDSVRLLTLRGAGGVGKTTLATWALETGKTWFQDGTVWVALQPVSSLEDLPLAIASVLNLSLSANTPVWDQIREHLRCKNTLLILDNFEHLRGVSESLIGLLEAAPKLKLLVTSRVSLGLPGELLIVLEGLDYPKEPNLELAQSSSAVRLFVERAARRRAGFVLSNQTMPGILRICAAVHGLPLGLELAAAWAGELSPDALADGLESNSDLPELESEGAHRSLQVVFEHSWELLEDELRNALSTVSVFRGGFERRAALEGMGISARALLGLVGRSLLQSLPGGRYDLHSVVQTFAAQKLEQAQLKHLQLDHARYFARFAEQAQEALQNGAIQVRWLERIAADHQNILAVLQWGLTENIKLAAGIVGHLVHYWYSSGHRREGSSWAQRFLHLHTSLDSVRQNLIWTQASLCVELGEYKLARNALSAYQELAGILEDKSALARAEMLWGVLERECRNLELAKIHLHRASKMLEAVGDQNRLNNCLNNLGTVYHTQGDLETAKIYYQQSLHFKRIIGDKQAMGYTLCNLGSIAGTQGDYTLEKTLLEESLRLGREIGNQHGIASALHFLGASAIEQKQFEPAVQHLTQALEIFLRLERRISVICILQDFAEIAAFYKQFSHSITLNTASISLLEQTGSTPRANWIEAKKQICQESQLDPVMLEKLELEGKNLTLLESVAFALVHKDLWLESGLLKARVSV